MQPGNPKARNSKVAPLETSFPSTMCKFTRPHIYEMVTEISAPSFRVWRSQCNVRHRCSRKHVLARGATKHGHPAAGMSGPTEERGLTWKGWGTACPCVLSDRGFTRNSLFVSTRCKSGSPVPNSASGLESIWHLRNKCWVTEELFSLMILYFIVLWESLL